MHSAMVNFELQSGNTATLMVSPHIPITIINSEQGLRLQYPNHNNGGYVLSDKVSREKVIDKINKALSGF